MQVKVVRARTCVATLVLYYSFDRKDCYIVCCITDSKILTGRSCIFVSPVIARYWGFCPHSIRDIIALPSIVHSILSLVLGVIEYWAALVKSKKHSMASPGKECFSDVQDGDISKEKKSVSIVGFSNHRS